MGRRSFLVRAGTGRAYHPRTATPDPSSGARIPATTGARARPSRPRKGTTAPKTADREREGQVRIHGMHGRVGITLASVAIILAACGSSGSGGSSATSAPVASPSVSAAAAGDPTTDKLAQVKARGTLVLWTDPDYAPQSMKVEGATRAADTKCGPNEMTAPEMTGYDAETGKARRGRPRRRAVLRRDPVRRHDRRELGRPLRRRLGLRCHHHGPDEAPLRHAAVLLDARRASSSRPTRPSPSRRTCRARRSASARAAPITRISTGRSSCPARRSTSSSTSRTS